MTNSVEPPPMSTTSSSRPSRGRSLVAPANVSAASSSPPIVRASRPKRSRTVAVKAVPLAASRTALVSTAVVAVAPCSSMSSR